MKMAPEAPNSLVTQGHLSRGSSGLPNQGQIDWVALANTTVTSSVGLLARISGAGVDPFTIAVGQAIGSKFKISRLGIHRFETAISNLKHASVLGEVMWFGFGVNHIIRELMQTTEGVTCVMLCAILSESRTAILSARVLFELTNTYSSSTPEAGRLTPSLQQWHKLVEMCAGSLSSSPFPSIVDQMIMLMSQRRNSNPRKTHRRFVGDPKDIASVLNALGRLSLDEIVTLTISGGCDCGWIAAVAHWFFDAVVEFRNVDGGVLYSTGKHSGATCRTLVVVETSESSTALEATTEAYTVKEITKEVITRDQRKEEENFNVYDLQSRVPWQGLFRQTFGKQAAILLRLNVDLGTAIGSAARIFSEVANPQTEDFSSDLDAGYWSGTGTASHGSAYLDFLCAKFPELIPLQDVMETALQRSLTDALAAYQSVIERLRSVCECRGCCTLVEMRKKRFTEPRCRGKDLCLIVLCGYVIQLALCLSVTSVPPSLLPTRSGLEEFYLEYYETFESGPKTGRNPSDLCPFSADRRRYLMSMLFAGLSNDQDMLEETVAKVTNGICSYLGVLHRISDNPEEMLRIFIIPGCIETRAGRMYRKLDVTKRYIVPDFNYNASAAVSCNTLPAISQIAVAGVKYEVKIVVEESLLHLTTHILIMRSPTMSVACSPLSLAFELGYACDESNVVCSRRGCPKIDIAGLSIATIEGEGLITDESMIDTGFKIGLRLVSDDPIARLLALLSISKEDDLGKYRVPPGLLPYESGGDMAYDGWIDYRDPDLSPTDIDHGPSNSEDMVGDQNVMDHNIYSRKHYVPTILQTNSCLPCAIRKAVKIGGRDGMTVYIVCR